MGQTAAARTPTRRTPRDALIGVVIVALAITGMLALRSGPSSATEADGVLPGGVTVFDEEQPGVTNLDPDLLRALRDAAREAADDGVTFYVNSGWRSPEYQEQLLREAISEYGSEAEARRWVATADTSAHVSGAAVDIGSFDAAAWLSENGSQHGLCQTYGNEPWHYERHPDAIGRGCPPAYPDPTSDPRIQPALTHGGSTPSTRR